MNAKYDLDLVEGVDFAVRRGHWLPKRLGVDCIAFGKTAYCRKVDEGVPSHEFLHLVQFRNHGVVGVVLHYLFHVARNYCLLRSFRRAFRAVPFEVEARSFEEERLGEAVLRERFPMNGQQS